MIQKLTLKHIKLWIVRVPWGSSAFYLPFPLLNFCHAQVSQIRHGWVGCCSCLAGLSSPIFLGLMGCGEFLFGRGSIFVVNAESSPFSLLCFCYAQLCHDRVGCCSFFGILGLHFCWVYCRLSWLLCWSFCFCYVFAFVRLCSPFIPTRIRLFPYSVLVCRQDFIFWFVMSLSQFMSCPFDGGVFVANCQHLQLSTFFSTTLSFTQPPSPSFWPPSLLIKVLPRLSYKDRDERVQRRI